MRKPLSRFEPAGLFFLAVLTLSASAQGQACARGSFTLPYEVQWQGERVPAGSYTFEIRQADPRSSISIRSMEDPRRVRIIEPAAAVSESFLHSSALRIVAVGGKHYVRALEVSPIARSFLYRAPQSSPYKLSRGRTFVEAPLFAGTEGRAEAAQVGRKKQ